MSWEEQWNCPRGLQIEQAKLVELVSSLIRYPAVVPCRAHERNVHALLSCALPYHDTNDFVRLVQVLHVQGTLFEFLAPMQQSGAALPRETLMLRCLADKVTQKSLFAYGQ